MCMGGCLIVNWYTRSPSWIHRWQPSLWEQGLLWVLQHPPTFWTGVLEYTKAPLLLVDMNAHPMTYHKNHAYLSKKQNRRKKFRNVHCNIHVHVHLKNKKSLIPTTSRSTHFTTSTQAQPAYRIHHHACMHTHRTTYTQDIHVLCLRLLQRNLSLLFDD